MIGTAKWFSNQKGYGFITPEDGSKDVFVHQSSIKVDGYRTLAEGQKVEFERVTTDKGERAENVRLIPPIIRAIDPTGAQANGKPSH